MIGHIIVFVSLMTYSAAAIAADSGGDSASGKAIFQHICQNCHSAEIGINKVGPSLWSVVGREPASVPDYTYSEAMKANKSAWTAVAHWMPISQIRVGIFTARECSSRDCRSPGIAPTSSPI